MSYSAYCLFSSLPQRATRSSLLLDPEMANCCMIRWNLGLYIARRCLTLWNICTSTGIWGSAFGIILSTLKDGKKAKTSEEETKKELGKFMKYIILCIFCDEIEQSRMTVEIKHIVRHSFLEKIVLEEGDLLKGEEDDSEDEDEDLQVEDRTESKDDNSMDDEDEVQGNDLRT